MHVRRVIIAVWQVILTLIILLILAGAQHQIDGRIAGREVLGIGFRLGMMEVEKGVGKEQIIGHRAAALAAKAL